MVIWLLFVDLQRIKRKRTSKAFKRESPVQCERLADQCHDLLSSGLKPLHFAPNLVTVTEMPSTMCLVSTGPSRRGTRRSQNTRCNDIRHRRRSLVHYNTAFWSPCSQKACRYSSSISISSSSPSASSCALSTFLFFLSGSSPVSSGCSSASPFSARSLFPRPSSSSSRSRSRSS